MAYGTFSGSNYFTVARNYNILEFSASAWIYPGATGVSRGIAGMWQDLNTYYQWYIFLYSDNKLGFITKDTINRNVDTGVVVAANTWSHVALVKTSTNMYGYLNGTQYGPTATTTAMASQPSSFGIGARQNGTNPFDGSVAELATWTRSLSASEVASLAAGFKPNRVSTPDIYIPLVRDAIDIRSSYTVTKTGSPSVENHPRVY
jgi:hypothetical protein